MRVLHYTSWYPNPSNTKEAIWIQRQIEALAPYAEYKIVHRQIKPSTHISFKHRAIPNGDQKIVSLITKKWFIIELASTVQLIFTLLKERVNKRYDIINFHIAYPTLTYWHLIKQFISIPIVISEHWSAYHFNFGVKKELSRVQRIFRQNIPLIGVSKALIQDIEDFSHVEIDSYVLANIVDEVFHPAHEDDVRSDYFFMVSSWSAPKRPLVVMEAFKLYLKDNSRTHLKIGGYGNLLQDMIEWTRKHNLEDRIEFLGPLTKEQIAENLKTCKAFLHGSDYETFSVVVAEAISCKCPIIVSDVGGIPEISNTTNGILVANNTVDDWQKALIQSDYFWASPSNKYTVDQDFSSKYIGASYAEILNIIISEYHKK